MQRVLSTVTLLGLLVATAAAFAITEHLKLEKSPIYGTLVTKAFSPVCHCATAQATISIKLRHPDSLTVTIVDTSGHAVATLATNQPEPKGPVTFSWDGRTATGIARKGSFQAEIALANARRTILLPNVVDVITTAPRVLAANDGKGTLVPGGKRTIAIHYALSESAHAVVYVGRRRVILGHRSRPRDVVKWNGKRDGRALPPGRYVLTVAAVDVAGNTTPASERRQVVVRLRDIALSQTRIEVRKRMRFTVAVATRAAKYTWRLGGKHGTGRGKKLRLRAPARRGTYRLVVTEHGHSAVAIVKVGRR